jgi:hypothetical protein
MAKNVEELTIVKGTINSTVRNTTALLSISSANCKPITMSVTYINDYEKMNALGVTNELLKTITDKMVSNVNIFGFGIKFYWVIIVILIISILIVSAANVTLGAKIGAALLIFVLLSILVGAIIPSTDISGEITPYTQMNSTITSQATIVDNVATKTNESVSFLNNIIYEPVAKLGSFNITYLIIGVLIFLVITGIFFSATKFDWWANILIAFFISIVITIILYLLI